MLLNNLFETNVLRRIVKLFLTTSLHYIVLHDYIVYYCINLIHTHVIYVHLAFGCLFAYF